MGPVMEFNAPVVLCEICGKPVTLETAKADDRGKPVHQECYAQVATESVVKGSGLPRRIERP